ncbi:hypothetical protein SLS62_010305 [Diatrype stigma]|uniref:Nephrocystin 3-like N-terminal domain-containing protein n=1 Tax=Diatrype stigma TaxID=117547 RepID=A0AAN9UIZ1_9PEZI
MDTGANSIPKAVEESYRALEEILETSEDCEDVMLAFKYEGILWNDVLESIQDAKEEYHTRSEKNRPQNMYNVHKNKAIIMTLHSLTDMIPDQDGLSVMRGGLKLIFKRTENRDQILRTFEDVPMVFAKACDAIKTHPNDKALHGHVNNLFTVLIDVTPKLIEILLRRRQGNWASRLLKQHPEQDASTINDCLDTVTRASRRVTDRVDVLVDKIVTKTLAETRLVSAKIEATQTDLRSMHKSICSIQTSQKKVQGMIINGEDKSTKDLDALASVIDRKIESATSRLTADLRILQTLLQTTLSDSTHRTPTHIAPRFGLSDPSSLAADIEEVLRAGNRVKGIARGKELLVKKRFRCWVEDIRGQSDILLVNGHLSDQTTGKISALSVLVALFSRVKSAPGAVTLHHFCGLHSQQGNPASGPRGLMQSLVAQLILYLHQHRRGSARVSILSEGFLQDVARREMVALCLLFSQLMAQLDRSTTVYCVIDNVSEFETSLGGWGQEMGEVVAFLQHLVHDDAQDRGPVLKVLMIASNRSIQIHRHIRPEDQVWLHTGSTLSDSVQQQSFEHDFQRAMICQASQTHVV